MEVKSLSCPNCGAPVTLRGMDHSVSAVCEKCLSVLDSKDPNLQVLQQFEGKVRVEPLIPLGTRGKLHGDTYEAIGFQQRTIYVDLMPYSWQEYVLFNPYKGFRYLSEYNGHWNDGSTLKSVPEATTAGGRKAMRALGETYRHFQSATAETTFVLGEFPWQVRVGEKAMVEDYIAPPHMLSSERTENETVWSLSEYVHGERVWQAFGLPGQAPAPVGTFANQVSPFVGRVRGLWVACLILLLALANMALLEWNFAGQEEAFSQRYTFSSLSQGDPSLVTPVFELKGRTSNVEVSVETNLQNDWAYFNFALINEQTGAAYDFGREVSYYSGRDDSTRLPSVPAGRYYLRVEPEMGQTPGPSRTGVHSMSYTIRVRRDVPSFSHYGLAALLLLLPPLFLSLRARSFEKERWQESDYAPASSDGGDD
jgi:hypothetical protein